MNESCTVCHILVSPPPGEKDRVVFDRTDNPGKVALRSDQPTIGSCFVTLKEHLSEVFSLSENQDLSFILVRNALHVALKRSLGAQTTNIELLMNDALRDGQSPHIHYHFKPRYSPPGARFINKTIPDPDYGHRVAPGRRNDLTDDEMRRLAALVSTNMCI